MIRDHGDAVEADLAFRGIDLRDLYRPGSGLTPRRLQVLIRAVLSSPDAVLWASIEKERQTAVKPTADQIRARQAQYEGGS